MSCGSDPLKKMAAEYAVRLVETDQRNYILDCQFATGVIHAEELASRLEARARIVGHGLFLGLTTDVVVASNNGNRIVDDSAYI